MSRWGKAQASACLLVSLTACASKPISGANVGAMAAAIGRERQVIILTPAVRVERIQDETLVPTGGGLEAMMLQAAKSSLRTHGTSFTDCPPVDFTGGAALCSEIGSHESILARGLVRDEARAALKRFAEANRGGVLLAHSMLAKVGPGWFWDPNSGAIRSGMSSSILHAAVIECASGTVLWKNEVLLRESLDVTKGQENALRFLYEGNQKEDSK